jgi:hypothetical protein
MGDSLRVSHGAGLYQRPSHLTTMHDPKNPSPAQLKADRQQWARKLIARHKAAVLKAREYEEDACHIEGRDPGVQRRWTTLLKEVNAKVVEIETELMEALTS